jgi:hypothetical protein
VVAGRGVWGYGVVQRVMLLGEAVGGRGEGGGGHATDVALAGCGVGGVGGRGMHEDEVAGRGFWVGRGREVRWAVFLGVGRAVRETSHSRVAALRGWGCVVWGVGSRRAKYNAPEPRHLGVAAYCWGVGDRRLQEYIFFSNCEPPSPFPETSINNQLGEREKLYNNSLHWDDEGGRIGRDRRHPRRRK